MTRYGNYRDSSSKLVELTKEIESKSHQKLLDDADELHLKLLKWQADYQKKNPKASLRNVKRAAAKHFGIKLK